MIEKDREETIGHLLPGNPKGEIGEPTKEEKGRDQGRMLDMSIKRHLYKVTSLFEHGI